MLGQCVNLSGGLGDILTPSPSRTLPPTPCPLRAGTWSLTGESLGGGGAGTGGPGEQCCILERRGGGQRRGRVCGPQAGSMAHGQGSQYPYRGSGLGRTAAGSLVQFPWQGQPSAGAPQAAGGRCTFASPSMGRAGDSRGIWGKGASGSRLCCQFGQGWLHTRAV